MSARSFVRIMYELKRQMNELVDDKALLGGRRMMDPTALYKPFNPQDPVDYTPQRSQHAQTISLNDLYRAAERGGGASGTCSARSTAG